MGISLTAAGQCRLLQWGWGMEEVGERGKTGRLKLEPGKRGNDKKEKKKEIGQLR